MVLSVINKNAPEPAVTGARANGGNATPARIECWISTRAGALRLAGTLAEVLGWMRGHCPCGKIVELVEVRV